MSYIPITIQRQDRDTEAWSDWRHLHALQVNRAGGGESFNAGAGQYHPRLAFDVRWTQDLEVVRFNTQIFRIVYRGQYFNITDYDDYMERRLTVRLEGEAYG